MKDTIKDFLKIIFPSFYLSQKALMSTITVKNKKKNEAFFQENLFPVKTFGFF